MLTSATGGHGHGTRRHGRPDHAATGTAAASGEAAEGNRKKRGVLPKCLFKPQREWYAHGAGFSSRVFPLFVENLVGARHLSRHRN